MPILFLRGVGLAPLTHLGNYRKHSLLGNYQGNYLDIRQVTTIGNYQGNYLPSMPGNYQGNYQT